MFFLKLSCEQFIVARAAAVAPKLCLVADVFISRGGGEVRYTLCFIIGNQLWSSHVAHTLIGNYLFSDLDVS